MTTTVRTLLNRVGSGPSAGRRNWLILVDTCVTALTGVVLLIGAARALAPDFLSTFAVGQLIIVTAVGILRAALYGPALAAQRKTGPASIPARWTFTLALPTALVVTAVVVVLVRSADWQTWALSVAVAAGVYIGMDALRNVLVSRHQPRAALGADLGTCVLILATVALHRTPTSPSALMMYWGCAGLPGLVYAFLRARRRRPQDGPEQSLSETWRLGRWGAADSSLAAVASLVPMIVSTAVISSSESGTYRVLQTALGPLNILFSTVLTVLMLDSWHTTTRAGLISLRHKVQGILVAMVGGAVVYLPVALPVLVWLGRLSGPEVMRTAVIIGVTGVLGAANTPVNGAALTLGRQHWGVGIRLVTVAFSVVVTAGAMTWVPWHDPIGVSMVAAAVVPLVGWATAYAVAARRESNRIERRAVADLPRHPA